MTSEIPKTYTPAQAADLLGVTRRSLYSYLSSGKLAGIKTAAGQWRITHDALLAFMGLETVKTNN